MHRSAQVGILGIAAVGLLVPLPRIPLTTLLAHKLPGPLPRILGLLMHR